MTHVTVDAVLQKKPWRNCQTFVIERSPSPICRNLSNMGLRDKDNNELVLQIEALNSVVMTSKLPSKTPLSPSGLVPAAPLANEFVIIDRFEHDALPDGTKIGFTDAASLLRLADGTLLCAVPCSYGKMQMYTSADNGSTWRKDPVVHPFLCGKLFQFDDTLYYIGAGPKRADGIHVIHSTDEGRSWSAPLCIFDQAAVYNPAGSTAVHEGRLYICYGAANPDGKFNLARSRTFVGCCPVDRLLDRASWRFSSLLDFPQVPDCLRTHPIPDKARPSHWLEGNVVASDAGLRVYWRSRIDGYRSPSLSPVCQITPTDGAPGYEFLQFEQIPGCWNHFHIFHDPIDKLYWLLSNTPAQGQERRILALHCSRDLRNWLWAANVVVLPRSGQSANYVSPLIDGEDLLIVSRTAYESASFHDNDLVTFHRLPGFRKLAI